MRYLLLDPNEGEREIKLGQLERERERERERPGVRESVETRSLYKIIEKLKVYTDGSVLETGETGAAFVIPDLKISESFYIGKGYSIFTAELIAILMALNKISSLCLNIFSIVLCVDSLSVLDALKSNITCKRKEIIFEINNVIHGLIIN